MSDSCDQPPEGYFQTSNDVTRLFDNLQAIIPGLTTDVASLVIWNTIEDFYIKSTYRREHVYWTLPPGETVLQFDPYDTQWRVCRFMGFSGLSNIKFVPPGRVIDLTYPAPDSERRGEALLALKPKDIQTQLPYDVLTTYWETLMSGACHRLYLQPGKPYSDLNAAQAFGRLYRSGIASARGDVQAGHLRDGSSWRFPYFAAGGRAHGRQGL
jgi:hypothetical protein